MTDHKFTDDDVIKALECCLNGNVNKSQVEICSPCPFFRDGNCTDLLKQNALALINRQKAEIERLETENKLLIENDVRNKYPNCVSVEKGRIYTRTLEDYDELIGDISAEAIKEFAWRLKNRLTPYPEAPFCEMVGSLDIDALVKEMTEESK